MSGTIKTDFLMRVVQATPEQQAVIDRFLRGESVRLGGERARFMFRKAGSHWLVVFDGRGEFHLEDTLGARYLDYLLHHPNEAIAAFDLEVAICPEKAEAR